MPSKQPCIYNTLFALLKIWSAAIPSKILAFCNFKKVKISYNQTVHKKGILKEKYSHYFPLILKDNL